MKLTEDVENRLELFKIQSTYQENGKKYADGEGLVAFTKAINRPNLAGNQKVKAILDAIEAGIKTLRPTAYGRKFELKSDAIVEALRIDDKLARGGINDFHDGKIKADRAFIVQSIILRQKTITTLTGPGTPATVAPKDLILAFDSLSAKAELYTAVFSEIKCGISKILSETTLNLFDQRGRTDVRDGELILDEPIFIDSDNPVVITLDAKGIEIAPNTYMEIRLFGQEVVNM